MLLLALLVVFSCLQGFVPLSTAVQIGADEGFELAKATLCLKGYKLYSDIWDDHPPLHTFLITEVLKHFTPSAAGPRLVSVAFAAILLTSVFAMVLRVSGLFAAGTATMLLIASPSFMELSSSCMMEIPALTPAIAGLCALFIFRESKWHTREILGGILFGVALATKLLALMLLPLAALAIWLNCWRGLFPFTPSRSLLKHGDTINSQGTSHVGIIRFFLPRGVVLALFVLGITTALTFLAIVLAIDGGSFLMHFHQTWASHFTHAVSYEYGSPNDHRFPLLILLKNWEMTLPAGVGVILLLRRAPRDPLSIFPVAWLGLVLLVLATHTPWWSYYYLHLAPSLCWCAGCGIALAFGFWLDKPQAQRASALRMHQRRRVGAFAVLALYMVCALAWMGLRVYLQICDIRRTPQTYYALVLNEIERFKPFTEWIYSDNLTYSFHTGIPVPPQLAVVSLKRIWSGEITATQVGDEVRKFKPGVIALRNDSRELPFQDLLNAEYRLVYQDTGNRLYALRTIANKRQ